MIEKLRICITDETYPYRNLALEEYLTKHVEPGECILYLWQNRHTVVIGKNQNCWKECKVNFLEDENGYLVRRLSGGGAVFHDLGNLNFTFMVRKTDYDVNRQLRVIVDAVGRLGIKAEKTGRNDVTVEGRKFSGNAFYETAGRCYHHGTLLLSVDKEKMSRYLNVSREKLQSKSVDSVKARVANLSEFCPELTVEQMKQKMVEAFESVYGLKAEPLNVDAVNQSELADLEEKFASWDWKYGRKIPFEYEISSRFPWGDVEIQYHVNRGIIEDANVFSDSMEQELFSRVREVLLGCRYGEEELSGRIGGLSTAGEQQARIKSDLLELIRREL